MTPTLRLVDDAAAGPLSLNDPATFVVNARLNGFTPAQAAALYHQRRLFSGWRWHDPRCWPAQTATAVQVIAQVNRALDTLRTPAEWLTYANIVRVEVKQSGLSATDPVWGCLLRTLGVDYSGGAQVRECNSLGQVLEEEDWADHSPWPFWVAETDWTWELVTMAVRANRLVVKKVPAPPSRWTMDKATHWLGWLCGRLGLAGLSLPWTCATPQDLWAVGVMLRRREMSLRTITGWEGPLLGLSGKLNLHVAQCTLYAGRVQAGHMSCPITMVLGEWPEVVFEHEWAHALDSALWDRLHPRERQWRSYLSQNWVTLNHHLRTLYENRHGEEEVMEDWRAFCAGILPAFQASQAYQHATPEQQHQLSRLMRLALDQKWTKEQVREALSPHMEPTLARFEFWLPWMEMNAQAPTQPPRAPTRSFPEHMYEMSERPEWIEGQAREIGDWWRTAIEHWARFVEICVDSPDPDYLHDPLRLPAWQPLVRQSVKTIMVSLLPLWCRLRTHWMNQRAVPAPALPLAAHPRHPGL